MSRATSADVRIPLCNKPTVVLNGSEVPGVFSVSVDARDGEVTRLNIGVEVGGPVRVEQNPAAKEAEQDPPSAEYLSQLRELEQPK